jgi:hypothetical protein
MSLFLVNNVMKKKECKKIKSKKSCLIYLNLTET